MKKNFLSKFAFYILAAIMLSVSLAVPVSAKMAHAQTECDTDFTIAEGPLCLPKTQVSGKVADATSIGQIIVIIIRILLVLSGVVAVLLVVIGGFMYMLSAGNQETADKGKKYVVNALLGLIIIVLSYTIVTIVIRTITTGDVLNGDGAGGGGGSQGKCPPGQSRNPKSGQCGS